MQNEVLLLERSPEPNDKVLDTRNRILERIREENLPVIISFKDGDTLSAFASCESNLVEGLAMASSIVIATAKDQECGTNTPDHAKAINGLMYLLLVATEDLSQEEKLNVLEAFTESLLDVSKNESAQVH